MEEKFRSLVDTIRPADAQVMAEAKKRWDLVAKPIGSLGMLEDAIIKIAGIRGSAENISLRKSALAIMCADHGVVAEGVTQTGQEVTGIVAANFASGQSCVAIMCRTSGTDLFPVDIGMITPRASETRFRPSVLTDRKIAFGSRNIVREAAMSRRECVQALLTGMEAAMEIHRLGYEILATGEMGIGNTTPSSALASVLTGLPPEETVGRGAGLSDAGMTRKREAVTAAVMRCQNDAAADDPISLLSELGGYDIAGLTGLFLGGAVCRMPVVIDGFISSVAALLAVEICPAALDYMLASHVSSEPAGKIVMEKLGLFAPLSGGMHLGEGSGAVALLPLLYMAADVYGQMSSFEEIHVENYVDYEKEGEARL